MRSVESSLISCGEAAAILGISLQAVHQGLRRGIVRHQLVHGRKMIDSHRLVQRWKGLSDEEVVADEGGVEGMARRGITFSVPFFVERKDPHLKSKLLAELPGIY